ncbi:hypothetical protein HND72_28315 [Pseudomonas putida]|uniref:hypothetical protein n=1 Tax=Pseudomonas putida TaxID=303 RepID=UPI0026601B84|nr:hypothetical protein [Pseudomonas putida]MDO1498450.1 hypothetical protein [Pseudomonas putida]
MTILKNRKAQLICALSMVVLGGASIAGMMSTGEKKALAYYEDFKQRFYLQDVLAEGDISYSIFSGNLTVENPEIRLVAARTNGAEQFLRGLYGLFGASLDGTTGGGLADWAKYQVGSTIGRGTAGAYIHADELKLSHSGDSKSGKIHIQLLGVDQSNQYLSHQGSVMVLVSDVPGEVQPGDEMGPHGEVVKPKYSWGANMAVRSPVTGSFLIAATGQFGTKVDLDLTITRSDDGEGTMSFVVIHRSDGSEMGRIVREARFAALPELDAVQETLKTGVTAFIVGAYDKTASQAILTDAAGSFARKTKVESYALTYKGFESLKVPYSQAGNSRSAFCDSAGLANWQSDFGSKGNAHSDSECAIATTLAKSGSFEETYTFRPEKTLCASLFVTPGFELQTN